jgi:hypothetical protein
LCGKDHFNGRKLSNIDSIAFTYASTTGAALYNNAVIPDRLGVRSFTMSSFVLLTYILMPIHFTDADD